MMIVSCARIITIYSQHPSTPSFHLWHHSPQRGLFRIFSQDCYSMDTSSLLRSPVFVVPSTSGFNTHPRPSRVVPKPVTPPKRNVTMSVAAPKNSPAQSLAPTPYSDPHVEVCTVCGRGCFVYTGVCLCRSSGIHLADHVILCTILHFHNRKLRKKQPILNSVMSGRHCRSMCLSLTRRMGCFWVCIYHTQYKTRTCTHTIYITPPYTYTHTHTHTHIHTHTHTHTGISRI